MTALARAFDTAGYRDPLDRLAEEAWSRFQSSSPDAQYRRRQHVVDSLRRDLTWTLIERYQRQALILSVDALLDAARTRLAKELVSAARETAASGEEAAVSAAKPVCQPPPPREVAVGGGQQKVETHERYAPADGEPSAAPAVDEGRGQASTALQAGHAPSLTILADRQQAAMSARAAAVVRLSRLDTFLVGGTPLGDLTAAEARRWAASRRRDARFVDLLCGNMPSDRPIREYANADMADDAWQRAEAVA